MRPVILKLLQQEPVTQNEWQNLFYAVHIICLWDEQGAIKMKNSLRSDVIEFIKKAQQVCIINFILVSNLSSVIFIYVMIYTFKCYFLLQ